MSGGRRLLTLTLKDPPGLREPLMGPSSFCVPGQHPTVAARKLTRKMGHNTAGVPRVLSANRNAKQVCVLRTKEFIPTGSKSAIQRSPENILVPTLRLPSRPARDTRTNLTRTSLTRTRQLFCNEGACCKSRPLIGSGPGQVQLVFAGTGSPLAPEAGC